eukprot:365607-Chlamydomonas_euryale.AAC.13
MEDVYGSVAQYYDVPSLSLRTAAYRLAAFKRREGFRWANLMDKDGFHPGDGGHKVGRLHAWGHRPPGPRLPSVYLHMA